MDKKFLAVGDTLINPDLLAYALVEDDGEDGLELRLGFASQAGGFNDLRLRGEEAVVVLRWLRLNSDFLSMQGAFAPNTPSRQPSREFRRVGARESIHGLSPNFGRSSELVGRY